MTAVTGLVDAVTFLSLGRVFTANMTGNIVLLAFATAHGSGLSIARSLTAVLAFLVGAILERIASAVGTKYWLQGWQADESPPGASVQEIPSLGREYMTRVPDTMPCVHGVVLGKDLTFLYPAPRAVRLVQFTLRYSFAEAS
jgi:hypothetical protein